MSWKSIFPVGEKADNSLSGGLTRMRQTFMYHGYMALGRLPEIPRIGSTLAADSPAAGSRISTDQ